MKGASMKRFAVYIAGVVWAAIFGLSFLVTKSGLEAFSPFELLFLRFTLATLVMTIAARLGFLKLSFKGKPMGLLLVCCLFQPIAYFACETLGLVEAASSTAGLILGANPALVAALGAIMLKEKLSARQTAGLVVSVAGVAFIVIAGRTGAGAAGATSGDSLKGVILIVGALLCAGFFNIFSRRASASFSPVETTFAMMASGAVFFGVLAVVQDRITGASGILTRGTPQAWLAVAYLGILSSVIAFFLVNYTLAKLKASQSAVFGTLTTLIALVAGVLLRGESFGIAKAAGALMIVAGVWATNRPAKKEGPLPATELPPEGGR